MENKKLQTIRHVSRIHGTGRMCARPETLACGRTHHDLRDCAQGRAVVPMSAGFWPRLQPRGKPLFLRILQTRFMLVGTFPHKKVAYTRQFCNAAVQHRAISLTVNAVCTAVHAWLQPCQVRLLSGPGDTTVDRRIKKPPALLQAAWFDMDDACQMRIGITTYLNWVFSGIVTSAELLPSFRAISTMSWLMLPSTSIR